MASAKSVLDEGLKLSPIERAGVARELIASLDGPPDGEVDEAWLAEAEQRQRDSDDDPTSLEDWAEVKNRITQRLRAART